MGKGGAIRWTDEMLTEFQQRRAAIKPPQSNPPEFFHALLTPAAQQQVENPSFYALGRMAKGKMNKTETRYAQLLDAKKHDGEILDWKFHVFRLRLADNTFYEPDFLVLGAGGQIEIHETKGSYTTDKGQLKVKLAAEVLPWFRVFKCSWLAKEKRWNIQEFNK